MAAQRPENGHCRISRARVIPCIHLDGARERHGVMAEVKADRGTEAGVG